MPDRPLKEGARRLRVGVVGLGHMGRFHAGKYALLPEVEVAGVVDLIPARAEEWAGKLGAGAYTDHRRLLGRVDAVSIAVPTDRHLPVARDFLESGSDVLLEKPIAATLEEAEELIALARKEDRILQVGHLERFNPAFVAARKRVWAPLFIEARRLTPFRDRGTEVDVVLDLMIHDLDLILSLVRSRVERVWADGVAVLAEKADLASARLQFQEGCVASLTASRISRDDQRRLQIVQPDGCLEIDYSARQVTALRRREEGEKVGIFPEAVEVPPGDPLEVEIRAFVRSALRRTPPEVSGEDGRNALALALRISEQIQASGEAVLAVPSSEVKEEGSEAERDGG